MKKKRPFLLLEVLIAVSLVALFAAPLMRLPIRYYRLEIERLEKFERQRIADWTFSEVKEMLLKEALPWDSLPGKGQRRSFSLPDAKLLLPHLPVRTTRRFFTLECRGEKEGLHGEIFRLYSIEIAWSGDLQKKKKDTFRYRLIVQRTPLDKQQSG